MRNLGVLVDQYFKFDKHISSVIGSSFYQLCLRSKIKNVLTPKTLKMAVYVSHSAQGARNEDSHKPGF